MTTADISKVFVAQSYSLTSFFNRNGWAYYIPPYQREYSWGKTHIEQLLEDVSKGVASFLDPEIGSKEKKQIIRFLGTVIVVMETSPYENIDPKNKNALPARIEKVIDGQQRISTLALIATQAYQRLLKYENRPIVLKFGLEDAVSTYLKNLREMFSTDLNRGTPTLKPIIIRGAEDQWVFDGSDDSYASPIAHYLAKVIRAITTDAKTFPTSSDVGNILGVIQSHLKKVERAHTNPDGDEPAAWQLVKDFDETDLWIYERPDLRAHLLDLSAASAHTNLDKNDSTLCSLVQLFAFCHFLLFRCCFTVIEPVSEDWAFDMFQSLNATGTPLTAIETFKPLVINTARKYESGYAECGYEALFKRVDDLFKTTGTAEEKTRLTNEFLTTFALCYAGGKLANRFTEQRRKLLEWFKAGADDGEERRTFLTSFSYTADYFNRVVKLRGRNPDLNAFEGKLRASDRAVVTTCQLYLLDANHKMAHTVLSRYFGNPDDISDEAKERFARAVKAVAAFFTLWRSAKSNAGLDSAYRDVFKNALAVSRITHPSVELLVEQLNAQLNAQGLHTFDDWYARAATTFTYETNRSAVCKFGLFLAAHNTAPHPGRPPLITPAPSNFAKALTPESWLHDDERTLEHVAPQRPELDSSWDPEIYELNRVNLLGNLTLLPPNINASIGNRNWTEKWFYYAYLGAATEAERADLTRDSDAIGFVLNPDILSALEDSDYKGYIRPIALLGRDGIWDAATIADRHRNLCEIIHAKLTTWLT